MDHSWIGPIEKNYGKGVTFMIKDYPLPEGIDTYILKGIKKGRKIKRIKAISKITGISVAIMLVMFIGAIRVSPVFASYAENIPGFEYIVKLIKDDKGLQSAVENDFIQKVGKAEEADNIVFTVKDIIVDSANMIVFYSIENKSGYKWPSISDPKILDANGKDLEISVSYGSAPTDDMKFDGKIMFNLFKGKDKPTFVLPDNIIISTRISVSQDIEANKPQKVNENVFETTKNNLNVLPHEYRIPITIDKSKFINKEKTFALNQTVEVEGQKITFDKVVIFPTRLEIDLTFASENTMKLFSFDDLKVIDEQGREWGSITNGVTATLTDDNHRTLYFQSNYFTSPKKLYITGSSIRALHKDALQVLVDVETKKFIKTPDDKLTLTDIKLEDNKIAIFYNLNSFDLHRQYSVFTSDALDGNKNKLMHKTSGTSSISGKGIQECYDLYEGSTKIEGPVTLTIWDYPNWIKGTFRVDVIK